MNKKINNENDIEKMKDSGDPEIEIEYVNDETQSVDEKENSSSEPEPQKNEGEETARLQKELEKARKEMNKFKEEYLRAAAENENLRKRTEREKRDFYQFALSEILKDFLNVLDNFERALESGDEKDGKNFREGIELIYRQFMDVLRKQGVKPIEIEESRFDPRLHQAFSSETAENVEEPEVSEVLQKGYLIHDRLLRPSLVKVKIPKKEE